MSDGFTSLDAHAYVDNSLNPADRAAFEAALRRDAKLRARVEAWDAQNEAIRLAFGGAPRARLAPALGRPSNENNAAAKGPGEDSLQPLRSRALAPPVAAAPRVAAPWRGAALAAAAFGVGLVAYSGGPADPREALMRCAEASLRTSHAFADTRLDFVSDDPAAVSAWLNGRFAHVDAKQLAPPGWSLLGVRIVAGLDNAAALVLYEDALGSRAGLLLEPTDALPQLPPIGEQEGDETILAGAETGFAYAAVGPSASGVTALLPAAADN